MLTVRRQPCIISLTSFHKRLLIDNTNFLSFTAAEMKNLRIEWWAQRTTSNMHEVQCTPWQRVLVYSAKSTRQIWFLLHDLLPCKIKRKKKRIDFFSKQIWIFGSGFILPNAVVRVTKCKRANRTLCSVCTFKITFFYCFVWFLAKTHGTHPLCVVYDQRHPCLLQSCFSFCPTTTMMVEWLITVLRFYNIRECLAHSALARTIYTQEKRQIIISHWQEDGRNG